MSKGGTCYSWFSRRLTSKMTYKRKTSQSAHSPRSGRGKKGRSREPAQQGLNIPSIFHLGLNKGERGLGCIGPSCPPPNPPATVFSRSALFKRTILSSLPAATALDLHHRMAPVTGVHERSSKMHSRVVRLPPRPSTRSLRQSVSLGYHRLWTCRTHRSHLPGSGQPQACPLRGFHGQRFRRRWSTDHNYRWCVPLFLIAPMF